MLLRKLTISAWIDAPRIFLTCVPRSPVPKPHPPPTNRMTWTARRSCHRCAARAAAAASQHDGCPARPCPSSACRSRRRRPCIARLKPGGHPQQPNTAGRPGLTGPLHLQRPSDQQHPQRPLQPTDRSRRSGPPRWTGLLRLPCLPRRTGPPGPSRRPRLSTRPGPPGPWRAPCLPRQPDRLRLRDPLRPRGQIGPQQLRRPGGRPMTHSAPGLVCRHSSHLSSRYARHTSRDRHRRPRRTPHGRRHWTLRTPHGRHRWTPRTPHGRHRWTGRMPRGQRHWTRRSPPGRRRWTWASPPGRRRSDLPDFQGSAGKA